uniref:Secreted protein n=1 Tax=Arundo donax TaxID=35708 RepID=A0A0A8ZI28_ARUDO
MRPSILEMLILSLSLSSPTSMAKRSLNLYMAYSLPSYNIMSMSRPMLPSPLTSHESAPSRQKATVRRGPRLTMAATRTREHTTTLCIDMPVSMFRNSFHVSLPLS